MNPQNENRNDKSHPRGRQKMKRPNLMAAVFRSRSNTPVAPVQASRPLVKTPVIQTSLTQAHQHTHPHHVAPAHIPNHSAELNKALEKIDIDTQPKQIVQNKIPENGAMAKTSTPHSSHPHSMGHKKSHSSHMRKGPPRPPIQPKKEPDTVPALGEGNIRIIPLGGVEEVGKNMTAIEYKNSIVVIDMGFQFKDENTPGIDYILPNTRYLEDRKDKIKAVIITHGHLDHIGGIPYIMPRIGNPALYSRTLTTVMIKKRQEEFPHEKPLDIRVVEKDETIIMGDLKVSFFAVSHTIPDSMGVIVSTPFGDIVHTGDLKLDHDNGVPVQSEFDEYEKKFKDRNVLLLMADSTNVENPGFSTPEKVVQGNIEEIIKNATGRLLIATFASLLERIIKIIEFSEKYGKKVAVEGRSMKTNIEICKYVGILKTKKDTIIPTEEMELYPPDKIVILATGAQGDEFAAMMRIANKTHKTIKIGKRDTILLSSSIIPGNERAVQKLKDNLSRQGAKIIHYKIADVHSSGHANKDETLWIHNKIHPKFFMPVHGYHYMLRVHGDIARMRGLTEEDIVIPDNGTIVEIQNEGKKIVRLKEKAASGIVMVDGFSIGDIQEVVIRDRQMLAEDGIFIVFAIVNGQTGKLKRSPDIISRGFVYLRESQELLHETRLIIKRTIEQTISKMNPINYEYVKSEVTDEVEKFLFAKTAKKPIVIPVILGI
ncbi:MAG: ribonuclease J [bacterium]